MKIAIDETGWTAKIASGALETWAKVPRDGDPPQAYRFTLPDRTEVITAVVTDEGTKIDLQPERSASHRALRSALEGE